jgi:hypothetical protein
MRAIQAGDSTILGLVALGEAANAMVDLCFCTLNRTRYSISDILQCPRVQSMYVQYRGTAG